MSAPSPVNFPGGWHPRPPDERDFVIGEGQQLETPSLAVLLAALVAITWLPNAIKAWAKAVTALIVPPTPPAPPPPPPTPPAPPLPPPEQVVVWTTPAILDQGDTPHCVGFAAAGFLSDMPVHSEVTNATGDALYYECKVIDGEAGAEDGSDVRSAAKALKNRGRISAYAFAKDVPEIVAWLRTKGPVQCGSIWTNGMFDPDAGGYVRPSGAIAGGHSYMAVGHDPVARAIIFQNSWGTGWGQGGLFRMTEADFATIFAQDGDALVTLENPL